MGNNKQVEKPNVSPQGKRLVTIYNRMNYQQPVSLIVNNEEDTLWIPPNGCVPNVCEEEIVKSTLGRGIHIN